MGNKITIEPVSRVEGHGKVTVYLNDADRLIKPICTSRKSGDLKSFAKAACSMKWA